MQLRCIRSDKETNIILFIVLLYLVLVDGEFYRIWYEGINAYLPASFLYLFVRPVAITDDVTNIDCKWIHFYEDILHHIHVHGENVYKYWFWFVYLSIYFTDINIVLSSIHDGLARRNSIMRKISMRTFPITFYFREDGMIKSLRPEVRVYF